MNENSNTIDAFKGKFNWWESTTTCGKSHGGLYPTKKKNIFFFPTENLCSMGTSCGIFLFSFTVSALHISAVRMSVSCIHEVYWRLTGNNFPYANKKWKQFSTFQLLGYKKFSGRITLLKFVYLRNSFEKIYPVFFFFMSEWIEWKRTRMWTREICQTKFVPFTWRNGLYDPHIRMK